MEHSTSSAPNERVWRITQLAKFSFNHPSVVLTASWRLSIFFLLKEFNVQKQAFLHFFIVYFRTVGKTCAGYYLVYVVSSVWYCLVLTACLCRHSSLPTEELFWWINYLRRNNNRSTRAIRGVRICELQTLLVFRWSWWCWWTAGRVLSIRNNFSLSSRINVNTKELLPIIRYVGVIAIV